MKHGEEIAIVTKVQLSANSIYELAKIDYRLIGSAENSTSLNQSPKLEDIFYNSKSGQLCSIYNLHVVCAPLETRCTATSDIQSIAACRAECQKISNDSVWDPVTMSCEKCQGCSCPLQSGR